MEYKVHQQSGILLNANEASYCLDSDILEEIKNNLDAISLNRYPDTTCKKLHESYASLLGVDFSWVLSGNGSDQMIGFLVQKYLGYNKKLYTISPDFSMYDYYAQAYGSEVLKFQTCEDGSFSIDSFIEFGKENKVDMILFSNPNNPTGHVITKKEMIQIASAFCDKPVVFDEAYMEFATESAIDLLNEYPNVFVLRTLSKAYGLAGIRCGFMISQKVPSLQASFVPYALNSVTQMIACTVLKYANRFTERIEDIKCERDRMYDVLSSYQKLIVYPSNANFIYGKSQYKNRMMQLLAKENIVIRNYDNECFRITVSNHEENELVLRVLKRFEEE